MASSPQTAKVTNKGRPKSHPRPEEAGDHKMRWDFLYRVLAQGEDTNGKPGDPWITSGDWLITMHQC